MRIARSILVAMLTTALIGGPAAAIGGDRTPDMATAAEWRLAWVRQFGSRADDPVEGVAVDRSGAVFVAGTTWGTLPGQVNQGGAEDGFLRKYGPDGAVRWTRQFGTTATDVATSVAVAPSGEIHVAGLTFGTFTDGPVEGGGSAFLRTYDTHGAVRWTRQFGPTGDPLWGAVARAVAVGADGTVFVVGGVIHETSGMEIYNDAFVRAFGPDGSLRWKHRFGSWADDQATDVAVGPDGSIYVAGNTDAALPGQRGSGRSDAFVRRYRSDGTVLWTRQFGTSTGQYASAIAVDARGDAYVVGDTKGSLSPGHDRAGPRRAFVRTYRPDGRLRWTREFGAARRAATADVAVDGARGVIIVGSRRASATDTKDVAYARAYGPRGEMRWDRRFRASGNTTAEAIALVRSGVVSIAGRTTGTFPGQEKAGGGDAFVLRLERIPAVAELLLRGGGGLPGCAGGPGGC